jgi:hypothetical protein
MEKISSQKVAAVLSTVPGMLRSLAKERDGLIEKVASLASQVTEFTRRERVETLAKTAASKQIDSLGENHEEKVASIEAALEQGRSLDVIEEAVKLSSPRGELGNLSGDDLVAGNGSTELESYLLGQLE